MTYLSSEDQSTSNTSNAAQSRQGSGAKCPAPLSADVVRLVRHDGGNRAVRAADGDEDAGVLAPWVLDKAHDWKADERDEAQEADDRAARLVFVAEPRCAVHHEAACCVGRGAHALRHGNAELQLCAQDDREEEGETVGNRSYTEEDEGEAVDVPLCCRGEELLPCECLRGSVATIGIELVDNEVDIAGLLQESPRGLGLLLVGKLDDEGEGEDGDAAGDYTLHDEYPK